MTISVDCHLIHSEHAHVVGLGLLVDVRVTMYLRYNDYDLHHSGWSMMIGSWRWWGCGQAPCILCHVCQRSHSPCTRSTSSPLCTLLTPPPPWTTSSTSSMSCSCLKVRDLNQSNRITLENVVIGFMFSSMVFIRSVPSLTLQKLHSGPFLELKTSKSPSSMRKLVNLYWPSSRSTWLKSSFKVSGRLLMSRPSSSTTWKHSTKLTTSH